MKTKSKKKKVLSSRKNFSIVILLYVAGIFSGYTIKQHLATNQNLSLKNIDSNVSVRFSPRGGCTQLICNTISSARDNIKVQAYYFTSYEIAKALIQAKKRGVNIMLLVDKSQLSHRHTKIQELKSYDIPVYIDKVSGLSHNKIMIIDNETILTGSFNWTHGAEHRNAENIIKINSPKLASEYLNNWKSRLFKARKLD